MIKAFFTSILILCISALHSQGFLKDSTSPLKPIACDCKQAIKLTIGWNYKYGPTVDTKGYGKIQEIPVSEKNSKYYFESEHNSAWYLLNINLDGDLILDIKPVDSTNDYDFLLFKYTDTSFCRNFLKRKLIPERSNLSRVNSKTGGETGLSAMATQEYVKRGIGDTYSKSIHVKKGEQYMLILDNVYDNGKGHTIFFHIGKNIAILGKIIDQDSVPISAEVTIKDKFGAVVAKTESDNRTGDYTLIAPLVVDQRYILNIENYYSIIDTKGFLVKASTPDTIKNKPRVLPQMKPGKTFNMSDILFYGDSPEMLPSCLPRVDLLYAFLVVHNKMKILIEGHVDDPYNSRSYDWDQNLSESRSKTVYDYLSQKGIDSTRMSKIGYANKHPVYPYPKNEGEDQANRRVAIYIISDEK